MYIDFTNNKIGKLTIIKQDSNIGRNRAWLCQCECGNYITKTSCALKIKGNKSCTRCNHYEGFKGKFWSRITKSAKNRKLEFKITLQEAWDLWLQQKGLCKLSGVQLILPNNSKEKYTASLDRIDNTKGYSKENCQWIHKVINMAKNILDDDTFISLAHDIVKMYPNNPNKNWTIEERLGCISTTRNQL